MSEEETQILEVKEGKVSKQDVKINKEEIKKEKIQLLKNKEEQIVSDWKKSIKQGEIIQKPAYFEMQHYINMVTKHLSFGCIITSRAGTGKTFTTLTLLEKNNVDYAYLDSYSTPSAFYIFLYKNRNKIKVFDDLHKILESDKFAPFLKAVLWDVNGKRVVHYNSTKHLEDENGVYENTFEEEGGCIILTNKINDKNVHIDAILSRVNLVKLEINNQEMLDNMACVVEKPYRNLSRQQRNEVYDFLKQNFATSVDLNLRTLIKAFNFYEYARTTNDLSLWKRLTMRLLKKEDYMLVMEKLQNDSKFESEESKVVEYDKLTGRKRATYFRDKDEYLAEKVLSQVS